MATIDLSHTAIPVLITSLRCLANLSEPEYDLQQNTSTSTEHITTCDQDWLCYNHLSHAQETSPKHEFSGDAMRMKKTDRRVCIRLLSDDVGTRTNERE